MLIMHYTGMKDAQAAQAKLTDPEAEVSAHYMVEENGRVIQLVAENKRAWHAGRSFWQGEEDVNSCSIGIEIVNAADLAGFPPFPKPQIASVIALSQDILSRHKAITPHNVLAHSDIAPERKIDPGEIFPWDELALAGIGIDADIVAVADRFNTCFDNNAYVLTEFQQMLAEYGYNITPTGHYDKQTELVTNAFQRHFRRSKVDGKVDKSTFETLQNLLASWTLSVSIS